MKSGIYAIVHKDSGRRYVGSAAYIVGRWTVHRYWLRKGRHHCQYLQRLFNKYGEDSFSFIVLQKCKLSQLTRFEQHFMDITPKHLLVNAQPIARSSRGFKHSLKMRRRISEVQLRIGANPEERARRSARCKEQHVTGRFNYRKRGLSPKQCKSCGAEYAVERWPDGTPKQSKYCSGCRPQQFGGYYKYERALYGEGRPKRKYVPAEAK